jgi:SAM-dependent methyltransferase
VPGAPNAEQREYWNSDDSREWVEHPDRFDEMLAPFSTLVLDRADAVDGARVLDVGCGNGAVTIDAARRVAPSGEAVGIDLSEGMLATARQHAKRAAVENVRFDVADAQTAELDGAFDALVSRFGIMFFEDPDAAFTNLASVLAPAGRVAFVCWCPAIENEWVAVPMGAAFTVLEPPSDGGPPADQPGPFRYGDPTELVASLERAGLVDVATERVETTVLLGGHGTFDEARSFVANSGVARAILGDASPDERERALAAIGEVLEPYATDEGIRIGAATWVVTARATAT